MEDNEDVSSAQGVAVVSKPRQTNSQVNSQIWGCTPVDYAPSGCVSHAASGRQRHPAPAGSPYPTSSFMGLCWAASGPTDDTSWVASSGSALQRRSHHHQGRPCSRRHWGVSQHYQPIACGHMACVHAQLSVHPVSAVFAPLLTRPNQTKNYGPAPAPLAPFADRFCCGGGALQHGCHHSLTLLESLSRSNVVCRCGSSPCASCVCPRSWTPPSTVRTASRPSWPRRPRASTPTPTSSRWGACDACVRRLWCARRL